MTSKHTSGVTTKLRKLLQAMPNTGRGIIWQRSNGLDGERLEVFGSVATALKYILDNADDVVAALAPSDAEPVGWLVKDYADGWFFVDKESERRIADIQGHAVKAVYDAPPHPDSSSDAEPVAWVDELGNFWLTEAVAKQYDAKPLYTHPDSSSEALRDALQQAEIAVTELCHDQDEANECWNILRRVQAALKSINGEVKP